MTLAEARKRYRVETLSNDPQYRFEVFTPEGTNYGGRHSTLAQNMGDHRGFSKRKLYAMAKQWVEHHHGSKATRGGAY